MAERRALTFTSLDRVMPDVDTLLEGYTRVGNWSLGQVCNHLSRTLQGSVDGFSFQAPWLIRKTLAPIFFRRMMRSGSMPAGAPGPKQLVPSPGLDDRAEAEALRGALRLYAAHTGPLAVHPFFGKLTNEEWTRLHCIHSALHLSFLLPGKPN